jgi:hypothetical protein
MNAMETMLSAVADTFDAKALNALVEMRAPEDAAAGKMGSGCKS